MVEVCGPNRVVNGPNVTKTRQSESSRHSGIKNSLKKHFLPKLHDERRIVGSKSSFHESGSGSVPSRLKTVRAGSVKHWAPTFQWHRTSLHFDHCGTETATNRRSVWYRRVGGNIFAVTMCSDKSGAAVKSSVPTGDRNDFLPYFRCWT